MADMIEYSTGLMNTPLDPPGTSLERVQDKGRLRQFLMKDRYANAYLLGKLDQAYDPFCKWYAQTDAQGAITDLLLLYQGLSIPVTFFASAIDSDPHQFFQSCQSVLPRRFEFHVIHDGMSIFRDAYRIESCQKMHRMGLERANYLAATADLPDTHEHVMVERLGHRDTAAIMELYQHYPDHFFEPFQLESGLYFGVRHPEEGKLLSIAGVHSISHDYDVAVIGNLVTHPDARGKGLATACTSTLLKELFQEVSFVALNVQYHNAPAIRMYTNFGFAPNNIFYEGRSES